MFSSLLSNTQPILVLLIGVVILAFVAYINWFNNIKPRTVQWIAKKIFKNGPLSDATADGLFMNITVILLVIGLLWFGLGIGYLTS